jgi:hypothetical protein
LRRVTPVVTRRVTVEDGRTSMKHCTKVIVCVLVTGLMAACGSGQTDTGETLQERSHASGIEITSELDDQSGQVILPYDRFIPDASEESVLHRAGAASAVLCQRDLGVPVVAYTSVDQPIYLSEHFYGPWTMGQAQEFGFARPLPDADLRANGIIPEGDGEPSANDPRMREMQRAENEKIPPSEHERSERACAEEFRRWIFEYDGPWHTELGAVDNDVKSSREFKQIVGEFNACLESRGLEPNPEQVGIPEGADAWTIDETQITLAVSTVECKDNVDFTRRVAEIHARLQAPILLKYEGELTRSQADLRELLSTAKSFHAAHPEVYDPAR